MWQTPHCSLRGPCPSIRAENGCNKLFAGVVIKGSTNTSRNPCAVRQHYRASLSPGRERSRSYMVGKEKRVTQEAKQRVALLLGFCLIGFNLGRAPSIAAGWKLVSRLAGSPRGSVGLYTHANLWKGGCGQHFLPGNVLLGPETPRHQSPSPGHSHRTER